MGTNCILLTKFVSSQIYYNNINLGVLFLSIFIEGNLQHWWHPILEGSDIITTMVNIGTIGMLGNVGLLVITPVTQGNGMQLEIVI